jgi:hypothetical protein
MPKSRPSRAVGVRLLHVVDAYLRKKQRGKGDMSKLIYEALTRIDLSSVPLITIHGKRQPTVAKVTQIVMPQEIRQLIEHWSENRRCSMNELLNSALAASLPNARRGRDPDTAHPAVLNEMNAAQREVFFTRLLSLTGSDATPSLRSREGSYYEYDSEAAGTVEITQDGRRFLVESMPLHDREFHRFGTPLDGRTWTHRRWLSSLESDRRSVDSWRASSGQK